MFNQGCLTVLKLSGETEDIDKGQLIFGGILIDALAPNYICLSISSDEGIDIFDFDDADDDEPMDFYVGIAAADLACYIAINIFEWIAGPITDERE